MKLNPAAARLHVLGGGARGVKAAADLLFSASRERVPVDSGRLMASGTVQAQGLGAQLSYSAPYAAVVHEKQVKYLEDPMNDPGLQAQMLSVFARELQIP